MEGEVKRQAAAFAVATASVLRDDRDAALRVNEILNARWMETQDTNVRRALSIATKQVHWIVVECEQALARLEKGEK